MRWLRFGEDHYVPAPVYPVPLPVMVGYVGRSECDETVVNARPVSDIWAVELILQGQMVLTQGGVQSVISEGEVMVLKTGVPHTYAPAPGTVLRKYFIQLLGELPDKVVPELPDHIRPPNAQETKNRFWSVVRTSKERRPGCESVLSVLAYDLLIHLRLIGEAQDPSRPPLPEAIERALRFMTTALDRSPRVSEIARAAGVSAPHLHHLFRHRFGAPPLTWLRRRKIEEAKRRLANAEISCKTIAVELGFRDPLYFSAVFKRETGVYPTEWRAGRRPTSSGAAES